MVVKDSNGATLNEGDSIQVIKDLKVKGSSTVVKRGTVFKNIHLTDDVKPDLMTRAQDQLREESLRDLSFQPHCPALQAAGDDIRLLFPARAKGQENQSHKVYIIWINNAAAEVRVRMARPHCPRPPERGRGARSAAASSCRSASTG